MIELQVLERIVKELSRLNFEERQRVIEYLHASIKGKP
jgi:hypothetical protein